VHCNGRVYVPAKIEASILRRLRFPPGSTPHGSTRDLFAAVADVLRTHGGLSAEYAHLASYFVFATYFADCLPIAPCLLVAAFAGAGVVQLLRVLGACCRHSLLLAGVSPAGMRELPGGLRPTLLVYQSERRTSTERLLLLSQLRDFGVLRGGGVRDLFCSKAIYVGPHNLSSPVPGACEIHLAPTRGQPVWDEHTEQEVAAELQPKLLHYRMQNYERVRSAHFDVHDFTGPTKDLARLFGRCITGDPEIQSGILDLLRPQDEVFRAQRSLQPESLVLEALLVLCHEPHTDRIHVGEVTKLANGILRGRGETVQMSTRQVGSMLKSLRVLTQRDAKGYAFRLSTETCRKVHELARDLEVPSIQVGVPDCEQCVEPTGGT
jgi:hypothetical protein